MPLLELFVNCSYSVYKLKIYKSNGSTISKRDINGQALWRNGRQTEMSSMEKTEVFGISNKTNIDYLILFYNKPKLDFFSAALIFCRSKIEYDSIWNISKKDL